MDEFNKVLYVGKAINLKARVSSYFSSSVTGEKTRLLVSKIYKIRIVLVESDLEALLLEAFYIKKYNPWFNIRLTDGKAYILVHISIKDKYPKILFARRSDSKTDIYFGPFPSSKAVKLVLKTIRKAFPFQSVNNHPKKVCLYNHLGLCPCPPVFDSAKFHKEYKKNIRSIIRIFEGKTKSIIHELEIKRNILSENEKFEMAGELQKKINALYYITQPIYSPSDYDDNPNLRIDLRLKELNELKAHLSDNGCIVETLERIETYDISNTQGTNPTGSMSVFINGEKAGNFYRKFKINSKNTPDDFSMMYEVLNRRLKHKDWPFPGLIIVDGGKGQVSRALKALKDNNLNIPLIGLAKREETIIIPFIKNSNLIFIEVLLPKNSAAIHLLQRVRDEAHRFAVNYHRLLRSKKAIS